VLLVDDDSSFQEISKQILLDMDTSFDFYCARCADEAFKKLALGHYDIVVSDYEMPQKDGLQFLKELRQKKKNIPFILFTGKGREEIAIKALNLGANAYYNKQGSPETVYGELAYGIRMCVERKKNEEDLLKIQRLNEKILNSTPNLIYIYDLIEHRNIYSNREIVNFLGYTSKQIVGMDSELFVNILHPDDEEVVAEHHARFTNAPDNATYDVEYRMKNAKGEWRWLRSRDTLFERTAEGLGKQILGTCTDITETRKIQDALLKSESQYRRLVTAAQEGIWAMDNNYLTAFVNPLMAKMLGYTESEMVGKNLSEFLNGKNSKKANQFLVQVNKSAEGYFDCELNRRNGSSIYVRIAASKISDDEGKLVGTLMLVSDITEQKILESKVDNYSKHLKSMVELRTIQLKDANEKLVKSERLAAIGELAGMVGHDLRNPLAGIKNATYFLKKKGATISETQAKEMLEIIEKAIAHSDKIINDLLDYSREMQLELTDATLPTLLDEAMRMISVPDRILIVNHVNEKTNIRVDADKIMRVFVNLIRNAIDSMPQNGTLEITSCKTNECIQIVFADTGKGISEEVLPKIFTPLFTTKAQGMGFGLAICKRIIEAHGGTIKVETKVNRGTTFTVTLPVKPKGKLAR